MTRKARADRAHKVSPTDDRLKRALWIAGGRGRIDALERKMRAGTESVEEAKEYSRLVQREWMVRFGYARLLKEESGK
jgi:hypothetical protein